MTDPRPPALAITGLVRRYGTFTAVDALSLTVRAGEIVGFLGANGAGKTTTLRCACGLLQPDAGRVVVAGHDLASAPRAARAALGFVPDRPFVHERLTHREHLEFIAALYDVPAARARERGEALLAQLALTEVADQRLEQASLGMRQKLAVAMAVLHEPALLMLDEPLVGLDPPAARTLKDLLRAHAAAGGGVLVSTHLLEVAERVCDRVVILRRGRVVADGTLTELRGERTGASLEEVFMQHQSPPGATGA